MLSALEKHSARSAKIRDRGAMELISDKSGNRQDFREWAGNDPNMFQTYINNQRINKDLSSLSWESCKSHSVYQTGQQVSLCS